MTHDLEVRTASILIGNSDDKLTQVEWSQYVMAVGSLIESVSGCVHFRGFTAPTSPRQTACWVAEMYVQSVNMLRHELAINAKYFRQDSVAVVWADSTEFVKGIDNG